MMYVYWARLIAHHDFGNCVSESFHKTEGGAEAFVVERLEHHVKIDGEEWRRSFEPVVTRVLVRD